MESRRVLIAEDHDDTGTALAFLLRRERGCDVARAGDGDEASRVFSSGRPYDLLVVDQAMPVTDGFSFVEYVRQEDLDVPILMLTGHVDPLTRAHARRVGVNAVMSKPVEFDEFLNCFDLLLKKGGRAGRLKSGEWQCGSVGKNYAKN
jgi:CheY-like chemotaxis protein